MIAGAPVEHAGDARVLRQVAEAALADDPPERRLDLAAEDPEQARLAGAVAADEADLVAGDDGEAGVVDDEPPADLHRDIAHLQHGRPAAGGRMPSLVAHTTFADPCGRAASRTRPSDHAAPSIVERAASRRGRWRGAPIVRCALAAAAAYVGANDPASAGGRFPPCLFRQRRGCGALGAG